MHYSVILVFSEPVHLIVVLVKAGVCLLQERDTECVYGEKCRFLHDVSEYMCSKAADLGDQCYRFSSFGWCQYGVTCRFSRAHTSPELKNLRNEELCRRSTDTVSNHLDKDLQRRLRKKQQRFPGAEAYLQTVSRGERPTHTSHAAGDAANGPETAVQRLNTLCSYSHLQLNSLSQYALIYYTTNKSKRKLYSDFLSQVAFFRVFRHTDS